MTDTIKQAMSALMDEEASEIEVHRILRQFGEDTTIRESWVYFQQIRAVTRGEHKLSTTAHLTLHDRISAAVAAEEAFEPVPLKKSAAQWYKPAAGLAVAASLVVAVLVGFNTGPTNPGDLPNVSTSSAAGSVAGSNRVIDAQPAGTQYVDTGSQQLADFEASEPELRELDENKQRKLREYLLKHDQMARKNPYSRTVIFKKPGENN